jgi:AcrR family transcriptional regulator
VDLAEDAAPAPDPGAPLTPVRRAAFGATPTVGPRGLRTQQHILDGAMQAFGETGYGRATLDRVADLAGCSPATIYQYFAGKDDLFRHLAGHVARQLRASLEALDPVTSDADGHAALHAWVARYADIHRRYEPVFRAFDAAAASDAVLFGRATTTAERHLAIFQARLGVTDLPPRLLDPMVALVLAGVHRALDLAAILRSAAPEAYERARVELAVTDAVHRALFGTRPEVNVHPPLGKPPPALRLGPAVAAIFERAAALETEAAEPGRRALAALLAVGDEVVGERGYRGVRVDHVTGAAAVSRGAFYTYFENIEDFVRIVAVHAVGEVSAVVRELPEEPTPSAMRQWLRRYNAVHSVKSPLIRVWVEAAEEDLRDDRAGVFDWGRRRMAHLLAARDLGDVELDGLVLLGMVEAFGVAPRNPAELEAAVLMVERGFVGREG